MNAGVGAGTTTTVGIAHIAAGSAALRIVQAILGLGSKCGGGGISRSSIDGVGAMMVAVVQGVHFVDVVSLQSNLAQILTGWTESQTDDTIFLSRKDGFVVLPVLAAHRVGSLVNTKMWNQQTTDSKVEDSATGKPFWTLRLIDLFS